MTPNSNPLAAALMRACAPLRLFAALALWLLLAGYLFGNKPLALAGVPPLYIGEMVLALCCVAVLPFFSAAIWAPLRRSWPLRLTAVFFVYGVLRVAAATPEYGLLAARDGITAGYAILAFLAPALWSALPYPHRRAELPFAHLPGQVARVVLPVALAGTVFVAAILYGKYNIAGTFWQTVKPDFLTLTVAAAFWACVVMALKHQPFRRPLMRLGWRIPASLLAAALAVLALFVLRRMPTRGVQVALGPLLLLLAAAWAWTRPRRTLLALAGGLCLVAVCVKALPPARKLCGEIYAKYAPQQQLDFDIDAVEADLRKNPESYPTFAVGMDLANLSDEALAERRRSVFFSTEQELKTYEGRRAGHANEWRLLYWLRTVHYTWRHAPWLGLGFGPNLTDLNRRSPDVRSRESPAWCMFLPAMSETPPLRSPHCAHLTVFARLGVPGLLLWLGILATTLAAALRACWRSRRAEAACRARQAFSEADVFRAEFFSGIAVLGLWLIYLTAMTFGVVLENPFGGMWFWALTGVLACWAAENRENANDNWRKTLPPA